MNRIYQGRVSCVQTLRPITECNCKPAQHGTKPEHWIEMPDGEATLWAHHELFQDAVNYYIVALASLGTSPDGNLTRLRSLLETVWTGFDKKGQRRQGMGESLKRAWQLEAPPTLNEAVQRFQQPLLADNIPLSAAEMAAEFLIFKLGGETSIKNNGPVFFPMFCDPESEPTYLLSAGRRGRVDDEARLREELHRELSITDIVMLSKSITLGSVVNLQPGAAPDKGEAAIARIKESAQTFLHDISEMQLASWVSELSVDFALPRNRGGAINTRRVHACILFLAFPNETTKTLFQSTFPAPKLLRKKAADSDNEDKTQDEDFMVDGDDPIKLSRGTRGLVFVGFTALPIWQGDGRLLHWKRFDIEAFKEALKVYNQFQQNREKREEKLDGLATKLLLMDGEQAIQTYAGETAADQDLHSRLSRIWLETKGKPKTPKNDSGEEQAIASFKDDPRITRLRRIITDDLAQEYRLTDGRRTPYGLRRRTMKGWSEVRRLWLKIVKLETTFSEELRCRLKDELDKLRSGEKKEQIGSHRLFEALIADAEAWAIWREPDATLQEKINKGWAADPLEAFREYCEIREAFEEVSARALNFTPADARYSRRLFMFTDACSFGNDSGDYKHDLKALGTVNTIAKVC